MTDRMPRGPRERAEKILVDLLKLNSQLMKGVQHITIDYQLANDAPVAARKLLDDIRTGEVRVERWQPPPDFNEDEELEDDFG